MVDIVAEVGGASSNSYLTLEDADKLMDGYSNAEKWLNLSDLKRSRFLLQAARLVDRFKKWPPKKNSSQTLAFPTSKDSQAAIAAEVVNAVCETLDYLASGRMVSLKRLQAERVRSSSLLGQNATFDVDRSELPAGARNELEKLWKAYSGPVVTVRPVYRAGQSTPRTGSLFSSDCGPVVSE